MTRTHTTTLCTLIGIALASPAARAQAEETESSVSIAEAFFIQRDATTGAIEWLGSGITWLLMLMSVACVALLVSRFSVVRRSVALPAEAIAGARSTALTGVDQVRKQLASDEGSLFARVTRAALDHLPQSDEAGRRAAEQEAETALLERLRSLEPLNIIGNVAPMIGLFGTVYGMIVAFREIVASGGTPDAIGLAAGIGTALTTTFWGLVVAIPALAGYAVLRNRAEGLSVEAVREAEGIVERLIAMREEPAR